MKRLSVLAAALVVGTLPAWAESRSYDVPPFNAVSVSAGIAAVIEVGGSQAVTADAANDAILNRLEVTVRDNRLEVGIKWNPVDLLFGLGQRRQITVRIAAPELIAVSATSGSDVDVDRMAGAQVTLDASSGASLNVDGLAVGVARLDASSGAALHVSGTCESLTAEVSSGASIGAEALKCAAVIAAGSSGGHLRVRATASIDAEASSGGNVEVLGKPAQSRVESSSGGSVTFAD